MWSIYLDLSDNACVHRAATNDIDFRTDAAHSSVCNILLCKSNACHFAGLLVEPRDVTVHLIVTALCITTIEVPGIDRRRCALVLTM